MQKAKKKRKVFRTLIRIEGRNTRSARNKSLMQRADKNVVDTVAENYSFSAGILNIRSKEEVPVWKGKRYLYLLCFW